MPITLPIDAPTGAQYEDLAASLLRSMGYFLETRRELRGDRSTLLELDIVATPTGPRFIDRLLIEAKTGTGKYTDLFKLHGQKQYLGFQEAVLLHLRTGDQDIADDMAEVSRGTGVRTCNLRVDGGREIDTDEVAPCCVDLPDRFRGQLVGQGWYLQIGLRLLAESLEIFCRDNSDETISLAARRYQRAIEDAFFEPSPLDRVRRLYAAWQDNPVLAGHFAEWLAARAELDVDEVWSRARDSAAHLELQAVMLLLHQARVAIVKTALEQILVEERNDGLANDLQTLDLPQSFRSGLEALRTHPQRLHVPYFLQCFIELFGGWYGPDADGERELLALVTGLESDHVEQTLALLDEFFPMDGQRSWLFTSGDLQVIKMLPAVVAGGGAFIRKAVHELTDYYDRYPERGWLIQRWHRALFRVLRNELDDT